MSWIVCWLPAALVCAPVFSHGAPSRAEVEEEQPAQARLDSLVVRDLPPSDGREYLTSDEAGNVYVVQGAENRAYLVDGNGAAHLHAEFETKGDSSLAGTWAVAVGNEGRTWVFLIGPPGLRIRAFQGDKEMGLDSPLWRTVGVAVVRGHPVAALAPMRPRDAGTDAAETEGPPPLLIQYRRDRWEPLVERSDVDSPRNIEELRAWGVTGFDMLLTADSRDRLLLARRKAYDLREYDASGSLIDRVVVDGGRVTMEPGPVERVRPLEGGGTGFTILSPRPALRIVAIAWGPEGEALALSRAGDGWAIDRYVSATQKLERIPLEGLEGTSFQLAAGRHGLYVAPGGGCSRLQRITWEALRQAHREEVTFERDLPRPSGGQDP